MLENCRSQLNDQTASEDTDLPESGFMKSFKVATFEFAAEAAPEESAAKTPKPQFWEDILLHRHMQLNDAEQQRLGKGKRERKKVTGRYHHSNARGKAASYFIHRSFRSNP